MQCYVDYNNCDKWIMIKYYADFVGNSFDVYFTEHSKIGETFSTFFLPLLVSHVSCRLK